MAHGVESLKEKCRSYLTELAVFFLQGFLSGGGHTSVMSFCTDSVKFLEFGFVFLSVVIRIQILLRVMLWGSVS